MSTKSHKRVDRKELVSFNEDMAKDVCKEFINAFINECLRRHLKTALVGIPQASSAVNPPIRRPRPSRVRAAIR